MDVPSWVDSYVGIPYREGGRGDGEFDCWGLVRLISEEVFGNALPPFEDRLWTGTINQRDLGAWMSETAREYKAVWLPEHGRECLPSVCRAGDVVLLRVNGVPVHVGIIAQWPWIVHTEISQDSCVESLEGLRWSRRLVGVYRHERHRETDGASA